jgi:hypothetical protein
VGFKLAILVALATSGCSTPPVYSCFNGSSECKEYMGLEPVSVPSMMDVCVNGYHHVGGGGTWSESACSRAGSIGGCRLNSYETDWVYPIPMGGWTVADVMSHCADQQGTYIAP